MLSRKITPSSDPLRRAVVGHRATDHIELLYSMYPAAALLKDKDTGDNLSCTLLYYSSLQFLP
jgi:hypothetical protein